ncbi:MAG: hypothetical protein NWF04_04385 [Candidatus Bathyarchaeota archaeon]|nr:hypothetical protein [Candidatus Bathyarchaeota archaeon]
MTDYDYPKYYSAKTFAELVKRAQVVDYKYRVTLIASALITILLGIISVNLLTLLLNFITAPLLALVINLVLSLIISIIAGSVLVDIVMRLLRLVYGKIHGYPSPDEFVFAQCILTAQLFCENKRLKAARKANTMCYEFSVFSKSPKFLNRRGSLYAAEFSILANRKTEMCRMLLFSESQLVDTFTNFSLALVNHDDPRAYRYLGRLVTEVEKYSRLERHARFIKPVNNIKGILEILVAVVTLAVSIFNIIIG